MLLNQYLTLALPTLNQFPLSRIIGSWFLPLHPFSKEVWLGVILCSIIEAISIGLIRYRETSDIVPERVSRSLSFGVMSTYQIFCSQSLSDKLRFTPMRIIFFSCFMIDLIVTCAYGGGLATILTLPSFSDVANTLTKMVSLGLDWGAVSDAWIYSVTNSNDVRFYAGLYKIIIFSCSLSSWTF